MFDTSELALPDDTNGVDAIYIAQPAPPESGGGSIAAGGNRFDRHDTEP